MNKYKKQIITVSGTKFKVYIPRDLEVDIHKTYEASFTMSGHLESYKLTKDSETIYI